MKKRTLSLLLAAACTAALLAGCGSSPAPAAEEPAAGETEATEEEAPAEDAGEAEAASDEGKVLNIYCWNEEFKTRMKDHYPGYEEVDATHGKIGDVDVVWNITPSDDNAYQNNLDETL